MSQAESKLSRKIMDTLRLKGYFAFKVHGSEYMMNGLPDIIVCAEGLFFAFEVKMPSKRTNTSAIQDFRIGEINAAGGVARVICSANEALLIIDSIINNKAKAGNSEVIPGIDKAKKTRGKS